MTYVNLKTTLGGLIAGAFLVMSATPASAQNYKIGISAGLTGYAATVDRSWSDGVKLAADAINAKGGINGRKLEVIVEDNRSEPQEAVIVYRKMMTSDKVNIFLSGCVSAGNFAAASAVARAQIPMILCSILPPKEDELKWAFSTLPPARFEVERRLEYLRDNTQIRKIGVLHDPSPYANLQKTVAEKAAATYGIQIVGVEQYKTDDPDLSVQIGKMNSAGAGAILKIGLGGTTLTAAKNIKQLGLSTLLLTSLEDLNVFKPVADVLGDKFFFVAAPAQVVEALPEGALKKAIGDFLVPWRAKYGERDPNWAGRGWDAVFVMQAAIVKANSFEGAKVRDAIENVTGYQGTAGVYDFAPANHQGVTKNPLFLATITGGKVKIVK
ncbi:MAG: ABC transporter substrate-binding protein [Pseudomonadota bacterium]